MGEFTYDRKTYFDHVRDSIFKGGMNQDQVEGQNALLDAMEGGGRGGAYTDHWKNAYVMATAYHETAHTMQPIAEYGKGKGRKYGKPDPAYGNQRPYGRGYVQLTWSYNYKKADEKLDLGGALIRNFELAMDPVIAAAIIMRGSHEGWFTGKGLGNYINIDTGKKDYKNARRVINGTDRASLIAGYAEKFEEAMMASLNKETQSPDPMPEPEVS